MSRRVEKGSAATLRVKGGRCSRDRYDGVLVYRVHSLEFLLENPLGIGQCGTFWGGGCGVGMETPLP